MTQQLGELFMCAPHGFRHALDAQADAQRKRVDEETDRAIGAAPPCMRPNSTVPNTTSSRPDARASS
ncbi:hypothetical protein [Methylocapsa aurea]|uniref:hypothetical protein n=1 Tax=Methylocapsa aurea TaxID=663610 RepID=UPI003D18D3AE